MSINYCNKGKSHYLRFFSLLSLFFLIKSLLTLIFISELNLPTLARGSYVGSRLIIYIGRNTKIFSHFYFRNIFLEQSSHGLIHLSDPLLIRDSPVSFWMCYLCSKPWLQSHHFRLFRNVLQFWYRGLWVYLSFMQVKFSKWNISGLFGILQSNTRQSECKKHSIFHTVPAGILVIFGLKA